jgi:hypothetical protein
MKLSTHEDIEAPIDYVYACASDFVSFERMALKRGVDVKRVDSAKQIDVGATWDVEFRFRGRNRKVTAEITSLEPSGDIGIQFVAAGLSGVSKIDFVQLSPKRTRVSVAIELSASSMASRLFLQSLKLAKSALEKRLKKRVKGFADDTQEAYRRAR